MAILQQNPPRLCNRLRRQLHLCLRTVGVQTVRFPETSQLGNAVFIGMQLPFSLTIQVLEYWKKKKD